MAKPTLGGLTLNTKVIIPTKKKILVHHQIPERNGDQLQNMGFISKMWRIVAELVGTNKDADQATLEGFYDNNDTVSFVFDGTRDVKIEDLSIVRDTIATVYTVQMLLVDV